MFAALSRRNRCGDKLGQLHRGFNRGFGPGADNLAGNLPGVGFLAIFAQDPGKFFTREGVDEVGRGGALLALGLAGCGDGEVKDTVSEAVSRAEDAVSETVSRVEEGAKDAASRVESFFEESAGSRVDEELSSAGDRARSR